MLSYLKKLMSMFLSRNFNLKFSHLPEISPKWFVELVMFERESFPRTNGK